MMNKEACLTFVHSSGDACPVSSTSPPVRPPLRRHLPSPFSSPSTASEAFFSAKGKKLVREGVAEQRPPGGGC